MTDGQKEAIQSARAALEEASRWLFLAAMDNRMSMDRQTQFCRSLDHAKKKVMEL